MSWPAWARAWGESWASSWGESTPDIWQEPGGLGPSVSLLSSAWARDLPESSRWAGAESSTLTMGFRRESAQSSTAWLESSSSDASLLSSFAVRAEVLP